MFVLLWVGSAYMRPHHATPLREQLRHLNVLNEAREYGTMGVACDVVAAEGSLVWSRDWLWCWQGGVEVVTVLG
jgi:hypothetical protein